MVAVFQVLVLPNQKKTVVRVVSKHTKFQIKASGANVHPNPTLGFTLRSPNGLEVGFNHDHGEQGETIRLKSDEVAAAIASSLAASKLIIIGDYPGFVHNNIIQRSLSISALEKMMRDKPIDTYLAPRMQVIINALKAQTEAVHLVDGRVPHSLLLEVFTEERLGTMIYV